MNDHPTQSTPPAGKTIAPDDRARLDQVFMQVVLDVQEHLLNKLAMEDVVGVWAGADEPPACCFNANVPGIGQTPGRGFDDPDATVNHGVVASHNCRRIVAAHDNDLDVAEGLVTGALQGLLEISGLAVGGDDNTDLRIHHGRLQSGGLSHLPSASRATLGVPVQ